MSSDKHVGELISRAVRLAQSEKRVRHYRERVGGIERLEDREKNGKVCVGGMMTKEVMALFLPATDFG